MNVQKEKANYYWRKFLKSGSVKDYLYYRKYKRELEKNNEPNSKITGDSNQEDRL